MVAAARIAERMDLCLPGVGERLTRLLERSDLPVRLPDLAANEIMDRMKSDKKVRDGRIRFVLPTRIGEVVIRDDVPRETIVETIEEMRSES